MEWRTITTYHTGGHYCELCPAKICGDPKCKGGTNCQAAWFNPTHWIHDEEFEGAPKESGGE